MTTPGDARRKRSALRWVGVILLGVLVLVSVSFNLALLFAPPHINLERDDVVSSFGAEPVEKRDAEQLAYLLVKLELQTRSVIAAHFTRKQSPFPGVDKLYQRLLAKNLILPAAVADRVFAETVPSATGGRAWVKMVVDEPRNPNNRGDEVAHDLLAELRGGALTAERNTGDAFYYAEAIKAKAGCLHCHGEPAGAPDPYFPEFTKDGWRAGEVIGAVVARVARQQAVGE